MSSDLSPLEHARAANDATAVARLGSRVARRWVLDAVLGGGGMGTVYRARDTNGDVVALKLLHPRWASDGAWAARFEREARLANKVPHPAVVPVLAHGVTEDGTPYLVSEFVDGETLEDARTQRRSGALPLEETLAVADTLLEALARAHRQGIVHRDVKPANLMRTETGELRVLDFGFARELSDAEAAHSSVHAVVGTVGFMAPEQAQGRWDLVDARTDVWAAAATLLKLATGLDVHEGVTPQTRLALAATTPPPPLGPRCELPPHVAAALQRALSFSKSDRFPDASSFRDELLGLAPRLAARAHRRSTWIGALLGSLLALGLALFALPRWRATDPPPGSHDEPRALEEFAEAEAPPRDVGPPPSAASAEAATRLGDAPPSSEPAGGLRPATSATAKPPSARAIPRERELPTASPRAEATTLPSDTTAPVPSSLSDPDAALERRR